MELGKIIAFNLKRLRMERNLSQGQLAKEAGISKAMLSDIEKFCLERKILKNKLFETTDLETIKRVVRTVDSNRVFRFSYKQNLKKMSTVIHAYYTFLKSYKSDGEKKEVKPIIQDEIPSSLDTDSMKQMR